ncbi:MAG: 2-oxo acid dehydrogenase subunit E2 [Trueperaceae bacterium]
MATEFKLPEVGEGIEAGTIVRVLVSVGDDLAVDQPVIELETDKAVVEVPSTVAGRVESIGVKENEEARVGQVVLTVSESGASSEAGTEEQKASDAEAKPKADAKPAEDGRVSPSVEERRDESAPRDGAEKGPLRASGRKPHPDVSGRSSSDASSDGGLIPAAPSVRRLAREKGIEIREVQGSGLLGRISFADVMHLSEGGAPASRSTSAAPATPLPDFSKWGDVERKPMSGIRKATVRSMANAWASVPMVTHFDKTDITEFERLRKRYGKRAEAVGAKLTPTAMILKIAAAALKRFPDFNASIDVESNEVVYKRYINVGVAVDTEAGLLVPVIRNADKKSMIDLAVELGELAEKARDRKLGLDEMQGGNFSVSNLGGIGGTGFTPIVNPPDVAILGVSRGGYEPVYDRDKDEFVPRLMMPLALSYDHRLIDGASAARFLRWMCEAIEEPFLMTLEG